METGKVVMDGPAAKLLGDEDVKEFYLGLHAGDGDGDGRASRSATSSTTSAGSGGCQ